MTETPRMTPAQEREFKERRKGRNLAIGLALAAFAVLFFAITVVKMGGAAS